MIRRALRWSLVAILLAGCVQPPVPAPAPPISRPPQPPPPPPPPPDLATILKAVSAERMRADLEAITVRIGVRESGTAGERQALKFIAARWRELGLEPVWEDHIPLRPLELTTANVGVKLPGAEPGPRWELGGHIDSKRHPSGCPGANDNGSGIAVLLEVGRLLQQYGAQRPVNIWAFGGEEMIDGWAAHHHYGSRHHVKQLAAAGDLGIIGMLSVDMIGRGSQHYAEPFLAGPGHRALVNNLTTHAARIGLDLRPFPAGREWSDHEAYAKAGVPAVWLHAEPDPNYHTPRDTANHVLDSHLVTYARLVLHTILTPADGQ